MLVPSPACAGSSPGARLRSAAATSTSATISASSNWPTAGQQPPVGGDDHRVAVEDQLVLAADHVRVREGSARLRGAPLAQQQAAVVLALLLGRGVGHHQQARARLPGHRDRPAVLPQVLAHRDGDVDGGGLLAVRALAAGSRKTGRALPGTK